MSITPIATKYSSLFVNLIPNQVIMATIITIKKL
jgi:hypothetical protein